MIGKTIKHYKILEKLGEGGMGVVYKAEDTKLKRTVALKFLPREMTLDKKAKKRFVNEAQTASALDHPNICVIFEISETDQGQMFIAMGHYAGASLKEKIDDVGASDLPVADVLDFTMQIARGLSTAHEHDIVHRDIKPANIVVTDRGDVKIVDFGLAKLATQKRLTREGMPLGTVEYMSPEQVEGEKVDSRTDIWSLGVVLYEMLTGQLPFQGEADQAIIYSIVNEEAKPVKELRSDVPAQLEKIINKALAKDRDKRYQKVDEMLADLQSVRTGIKPARKMKSVWIGAATIVTLLAVVTVFKLAQFPNDGLENPESATLAAAKNRIAVLPFRVHGGEDMQYLANGMMDLLSLKLDGAGELNRVDPFALQNFISSEISGTLDPTSGRKIAEHFGAGLYILGNVHEAGSQIELSASLYDVEAGLKNSVETQPAAETEIFNLVDEMALQLLINQTQEGKNRLQSVAAVSTNSFPALKAYLEGESLYRVGQYEKAIAAYQKAVAEDSTFALAYYKMGDTQSIIPYLAMHSGAAFDQAWRHADKLSRRDRNLLQAKRSKPAEAEVIYREILASYPDDAEAWANLAGLLMLYGPRKGRSMEEAKFAIQRALTLGLDNEINIGCAQWSALYDGQVAEFILWTQRRLDAAPQGLAALYDRALLVFLKDNKSAQEEVLEELKSSEIATVWTSAALAQLEYFDSARKVAELSIRPEHPGKVRAHGYARLGLIELTQGRLALAREMYAKAEELAPWPRVVEATHVLLTPLLEVSEDELRTRKAEIANWSDPSPMFPIIKHYTLGFVCARLAEYEEALAHADSIETIAEYLKTRKTPEGQLAAFAEMSLFAALDLPHSVRAMIHFEQGDHAGTLEEFQKMTFCGWLVPVPQAMCTRGIIAQKPSSQWAGTMTPFAG